MRVSGRYQVASEKGTSFSVAEGTLILGAAVRVGRERTWSGCGLSEIKGAVPEMGRLRQGPQMLLSLLGEGTPDPPISRPKPAEWEGRGILCRRSRCPAGSNLERLAGAPSR